MENLEKICYKICRANGFDHSEFDFSLRLLKHMSLISLLDIYSLNFVGIAATKIILRRMRGPLSLTDRIIPFRTLQSVLSEMIEEDGAYHYEEPAGEKLYWAVGSLKKNIVLSFSRDLKKLRSLFFFTFKK